MDRLAALPTFMQRQVPTEVSPSGAPGQKTLTEGSFNRIALRNIPLHADVVGSRGSNTHPSFSAMGLHVLPKGSGSSSQFAAAIAKTNAGKQMPGCTVTSNTNLIVPTTMLSEGVRH